MDNLNTVIRHIDHVLANCTLLGERLIERGESDLGRALIANGYVHDNSKLSGVEWLYLNEETRSKDNEKFLMAMSQHITTNKHHPEYWLGIREMPRIYLAEFVCDITARGQEFGTDTLDWLRTKAFKKYQFDAYDKVYKTHIKPFLSLLLDKKF